MAELEINACYLYRDGYVRRIAWGWDGGTATRVLQERLRET